MKIHNGAKFSPNDRRLRRAWGQLSECEGILIDADLAEDFDDENIFSEGINVRIFSLQKGSCCIPTRPSMR